MIPKINKFPLRTEFLSFRSRSQKLPFPHLTAHFLPHSPASRLAVIVPQKLSKLATTRNWLKRLTYTTLWPMIQARQLDLVIVYKPLPLIKSRRLNQELINELIQTLNRF